MEYFLYISRSNTNELYIGQTNNLQKRIHEHTTHSSKSAKYVKDGNTFQLVYYEKLQTRKESMRREKQLKGWTRNKKEALIAGDLLKLHQLSKPKL